MNKCLSKLDGALFAAISKTMENMTFEEVQIVHHNKEANIFVKDATWAILPIVRPYCGQLVLEITPGCGHTFAGVVIGKIDKNEVSDEWIQDMLAEMANTIAGRFVAALLQDNEAFELGLPTTGQGPMPKLATYITKISLNIGGHSMVASIAGDAFRHFAGTKQEVIENENSCG